MFEAYIRIGSKEAAVNICKRLQALACDIDVVSGDRHQVVDGKSIMGLLSLDLLKPVRIVAYTDNKEELKFLELLKESSGISGYIPADAQRYAQEER